MKRSIVLALAEENRAGKFKPCQKQKVNEILNVWLWDHMFQWSFQPTDLEGKCKVRRKEITTGVERR